MTSNWQDQTVEMYTDKAKHLHVYTKPYPTPMKYREVNEKATEDMLEAKVIERAPCSRWNSPIVKTTKTVHIGFLVIFSS